MLWLFFAEKSVTLTQRKQHSSICFLVPAMS